MRSLFSTVLTAFLIALGVTLISITAFGQPTPPDPAASGGTVAFFDWLYSAAQSHNKIGLLAGALILVMSFVRWAAPKLHGKLGAAVNGPIGKPVTVLILAELAAISTGLLAGKFSAQSLLHGAVVAFVSAGGYSLLKPIADKLFGGDPPNVNSAVTAKVVGVLIWFCTISSVLAGTGAIICACNAAQKAGWSAVEAGILKNCATLGNAAQVVNDIVSDAGQPGATAAGVAEQVAVSDGLELAICAFEQVVANGGALLGAAETPAHQIAYQAAQWGLSHRDQLRALRAQ